ncbi:MAG: DUF445 domain-containing protein, partial [Planctomycetes bacterium]|nr:DUF445 domain-containing protein [Planctomycetota bacterium]
MQGSQREADERAMVARHEEKDRALGRARAWATSLLLLAALVYVLATALGPGMPGAPYVAAFCEAAMVGAMADWFAVVALFRHPLGVPIPHTAILPENKARIARGIAEFIQHNFLTAEAIVAKIAEIGPANRLRAWLLGADNAGKLAGLATRVIAFGLTAFDDARVRHFLHAAVAAKLKEIDAAAAAGGILDVLTENRRHHAVLDEVLRLVDEAMANPETRAYLARAVAAESALVDAASRLGWKLDEVIALKIANGAARTIEEVRRDPDHLLRRKFDDFIAGFIARLKSDEATRLKVQALRDELVGNPALAAYVGELWKDFRGWLGRDLADPASRVHLAIEGMVRTLGDKLDADADMRRWIDEQILKAVPPLVEENRSKIGRFIEDRINEWHRDKFVQEV